jgi:drug/metabolite transporter (DMT)-like permease
MSENLVVALVAGLGGMFGWGFADFFAKKTIDKIGDLKTLFWAQLIGVVPLLILFIANPYTPEIKPWDPLFLVLFGIVSALSYLPLYAGFGKGQVSLLSPIFASYAVVVVLLSALFLGEKLTTVEALAISTVFVGIVLISTDIGDLKRMVKGKGLQTRGVPQVVSAMVMYSAWLVFFDQFISGKNWIFYLLVIRFVAAMTLVVYAAVTKQSLKLTKKERKLTKYVIGIGLFDVAAFSFVSYGFSNTSYTSIVAMLSATFSVPTLILAWLFLKEKITKSQAFAAVLILVGVGFVSFVR